jgi:hypothetical protein
MMLSDSKRTFSGFDSYISKLIQPKTNPMKQIFSVIIFISILAGVANTAQAQRKNHFGVRAGWQSSAFFEGTSRVDGTHNLSGFYLGGYHERELIPLLRLAYGLEYSKNGAGLSGSDRHVINYLGIPVHLKVKLGPVYALVGVQPKVKIGEKMIIDGELNSPTSDEKSKTIDLPAYAGLGLNFLMFSIEARYHYGMIETNHGARNAYLQAGAALHF